MTDEPTLIDSSIYPRLVVALGGRVTQEITLREKLAVGRAEDNDLQLTDPKVSRHHARVHREGSSYILTDLGSANGTLVSGERITGPHTLKQGERFTVGDTELTYLEPGQAFEDTLTMPMPSPAARAEARPTRAAPPPPVVRDRPRAEGRSRGLMIGLGLVGALLVLALVGAILLVAIPDLPEKIGLGGKATPTQPAVMASPSAPAKTETPVESPTATTEPSAPAASPMAAEEFNEQLGQARALTRRSKFEEAIAIYEALVEQAPEDARPKIGWAWTLIYDDEAEEALAHAQQALDLDPGSVEAATVLARAYIETGNVDQALIHAEEAVQLSPGSAEAHAVWAEAYLLNGQTQEATDEADLALVQDINSANAHRIRAWIYHLVDEDMGRAAGEFQIAAGLQPELWSRRHELGLLLLAAENYNTAIIAFQDALGIRPKAVTYSAIGEAYYQLGQYDQAKASLKQAITAGAEDAKTYGLLAAVNAHLDLCQDAETYWQQALELDPDQAFAQEAKDLCEQAGSPSVSPSASPSAEPTATSKPPSPPPATLSGRIAFPVWNTEKSKYDTYIANVDGSGRRPVVEEMHQPAFSPDGEWLAVNGDRHEHMNLFIVKPDGSQLQEITEHVEDALPCWSPAPLAGGTGGKRLVFSSTRHGDKQSRVYIIDEVPFAGGKVKGRTLNFGPDDVRGESPAWTADGRIIYNGCDYTVEPASCGLFIMSAEPGPQPYKQLTDWPEDTAPATYGDKIAFMSNRNGNWEIYVMNLDGSGLKQLTKNASNDGLPTWSPDDMGATQIAFVSNQGGPWAVWAMGPDGAKRRKLFDIGGGGLVFDWEHEQISWAP